MKPQVVTYRNLFLKYHSVIGSKKNVFLFKIRDVKVLIVVTKFKIVSRFSLNLNEIFNCIKKKRPIGIYTLA